MALTFDIGLTDGVSSNALHAATSMSTATSQAKVLISTMKSLERSAFKANALGDTKALDRLSEQHAKLGGELQKVIPLLDREGASIQKLTAQGGLGPTLPRHDEELSQIERAHLALDEYTVAWDVVKGVASAAGDVISGTVGVIETLGETAIHASEDLEIMSTQLGALNENASGGQVVGLLDDIGESIGKTRVELGGWARQFEGLGIEDLGKLDTALRATASAQALAGDRGAEAFVGLSRKIQVAIETGNGLKIPAKGLASLAETGIHVDEIAQKMGVSAHQLAAELKAGTVDASKFGDALEESLIEKGKPALAQLAISSGELHKKFDENITKLFEKANTDPFMTELDKTIELFDSSTESGQALQEVVTDIINTGLELGTEALPVLRELFIDTLHEAQEDWPDLKADILDVGNAIGGIDPDNITAVKDLAEDALYGFEALLKVTSALIKNIDAIEDAAGTAETALSFLPGLGALGASAGSDLAAGLAGGISDNTGGIIEAAENAAHAAEKAVKLTLGIQSPSTVMAEAGENIAEGIARGISDNTGGIIEAAENAAHAAEKAVKLTLGIQSPSTVMAEAGENIAEGMAAGMDHGAESDAASGGRLAATAAGGASGGAGGVGGGDTNTSSSSASIVVQVGGIHVNGAGKGGEEITEEAVALVFERLALANGLG